MMTHDPGHDAARSGRLIGPMLAVAALAVAVIGVGWFVFRMAVGGPSNSNAAATARDSARAVEAGLDAAAVYSRQGKFGEATAILSRLAEQSPENQTVRLALAQSLVGERKFAAAYAQYEAAFALESAGGGQSALTPAHARLQFEAGTCANQAGLTRQAAEHYHLAQLADPADARYPLYLAMIQIKLGEDDAATASLVRAANLNPELAEAWGTLAELALKKNALSLASQHLENAERLQPEVTRWRHVRARIFNRQGEPEKAATLLLALPPAARRERDVMTTLAQTYGLLKRPADAARLYADAARDAPDDAELHFQAATWFERAGDAAKAAEHARFGAMLGHEGCRELLANAGG